jgi:methionyl-tRNA formyltransferase
MVMDEGVDTGPVLAQHRTPIGECETAEALTVRLFGMGARLLVEVLPDWAEGRIRARPQDESQATNTSLLTREDGRIDWEMSAPQIARRVRGYAPWPGTYTYWDGRMLKIIEASPHDARVGDRPGTVIGPGSGGWIDISTGDGTLGVSRLQLEGRRAASARDFLLGSASIIGAQLGS